MELEENTGGCLSSIWDYLVCLVAVRISCMGVDRLCHPVNSCFFGFRFRYGVPSTTLRDQAFSKSPDSTLVHFSGSTNSLVDSHNPHGPRNLAISCSGVWILKGESPYCFLFAKLGFVCFSIALGHQDNVEDVNQPIGFSDVAVAVPVGIWWSGAIRTSSTYNIEDVYI